MWEITRILIRRDLKTLFPNKKYFSPAAVILRLERYSSKKSTESRSKESKNASNFTTIEKNFHEKDFVSREAVEKKEPKSHIFTFAVLGLSITLFGIYIFIEVKNAKLHDENMASWKRQLLQLVKQIEDLTVFIQEPSREKLLPDPVEYPYYQPPYTLILEFTDVLAHPDWTYNTGWRFKKRPGLDYMLENLVGLFEIVVFTAEPGMTIFPVIEALDPNNLISYKLVRDSTHFINGHHVKNLEKLNRDLKKVIVVDWNAESVKFHPDNHLNVPRWKGENDDLALIDLTCFLKTIANTEINDVREVLRFYKQYDDPLKEFRNKQKEFLEHKQTEQIQRTSTPPPPTPFLNYLGNKLF